MSVENGERFIRLLETDPDLRRKVREAGVSDFLDHSASVGASCTPYEVVSAMIRSMDSGS
jgi:hypothetical protein